jgi:ectoine hydroxylase-related dioxygenase (phytanoyl-CoA dioxygenase family)
MINQQLVQQFRQEGYTLVSGLFTPAEIEQYKAHYMQLWEEGTFSDYKDRRFQQEGDPLKKYPRMMHPHRRDQLSLNWLLEPRLRTWLTAILGREPYAVQTMFYFKPPTARGQALHQDQYYLRVQPGTCVAAWMAIDPCDEENGCLQIVPGSQDLPVLCTVEADHSASFSEVTVPVPAGMAAKPVIMAAGDVLFFNGQLIHGSYPNTSRDRFRRSLIAHYVVGEAETVSKYYFPVLRLDGTVVELGESEGGGPCGFWVDQDGTPAIEMKAGTVL